MEIYKIVSLLKDKKGKELSISEIEKETGVKINASLLETLKQNETLRSGLRDSVSVEGDGKLITTQQHKLHFISPWYVVCC